MSERDVSAWEHSLAQSDSGVSFWDNILVRILLIFPTVALLGALGILGYYIRPSETPIVLHYNVYFGVDLLGIWWQAYMLPLLGGLLVLGHLYLAYRFYRQSERIASYLMLLSSNMIVFGILLATVSIAFINY